MVEVDDNDSIGEPIPPAIPLEKESYTTKIILALETFALSSFDLSKRSIFPIFESKYIKFLLLNFPFVENAYYVCKGDKGLIQVISRLAGLHQP